MQYTIEHVGENPLCVQEDAKPKLSPEEARKLAEEAIRKAKAKKQASSDS